MELRQLEYLVAVAEEASFTRAAQRVHISQSGVSAQIRQLERDLGATLIDRSGRSATLTPAGEAALAHARAVLAAAAAARQVVDDVQGLLRGRLGVGMVTACAVTPLFVALAAFHGRYPAVSVDLAEDGSDRLVDLVRAGELDVALIGAAGAFALRRRQREVRFGQQSLQQVRVGFRRGRETPAFIVGRIQVLTCPEIHQAAARPGVEATHGAVGSEHGDVRDAANVHHHARFAGFRKGRCMKRRKKRCGFTARIKAIGA